MLEDGRHVAAAAEDDELPALAGRNLVAERVRCPGRSRFRLAG